MTWLDFIDTIGALFPIITPAIPVISMLVDLMKRFGLPDGWAPRASVILNIIFWVAVTLAGEIEVTKWIDILVPLLTALLMLFGEELVHKFLVWAKSWLAVSHTQRKLEAAKG